MSSILDRVMATLNHEENKISKEVKQARIEMEKRRDNWLTNPCYLTGIEFSFALATYKAELHHYTAGLKRTLEIESSRLRDVVEFLGYENHMCERYWGQLVDGPMLASPPRRPDAQQQGS
jgi:hypothetical protein